MLKPLSSLKKNESGLVKRNSTTGELKQKLLDMGIVSNAQVKVLKVAPLGSPIDILIKGYQLTLRKEEAEKILVEEK
ncbi:MAG: FeoA family protein [Candidatus Caldatribacteriota bacterium]|nr:FeoA family protein [Candidatus Caldatribacteriota bacterium]